MAGPRTSPSSLACYSCFVKLVPTISLTAYRAGKLEASEWRALDRACADHGFFMVSEHGQDEAIEGMWSASRRFFTSGRALKRSVLRDAENPLGYYDRELTKQKRDQKEVFDFKCGGHQSRNPARRTRWPELEGFESALDVYFGACRAVASEVTAMVFTALGLDDHAARDTDAAAFGDAHTSSSRLNFYPPTDPLPENERAGTNSLGDMALHHHTDPGGITLLLQDQVGGLQALSSDHGWIDVPPCGNHFVVNLGDVMQVWTNDRYKAAVHRVLPMAERGSGRYSTPFFYQPRFDAEICPQHVADDDQPHYRPFTWLEFIRGRVTDNYADIGEDDIQISKYRSA